MILKNNVVKTMMMQETNTRIVEMAFVPANNRDIYLSTR